jgi:diaminopimelate decarboxylase
VMGSNYNSRSLPTEVLVNGTKSAVVRARQKIEDIWANESVPAWLKRGR